MSDNSGQSKTVSLLRLGLVRLFQVFIVLCLVAGFLDLIYPTASSVKNYVVRKVAELRQGGLSHVKPGADVVLPAAGFSLRQEPGIRNIVAEYHSAEINVAADGRRQNGQEPPDGASGFGLLLGSSTAFGYGVSDVDTLAANLERQLGSVRIYNYAGISQPTPDNVMRWFDVQKKHGKPEFVVLAGLSYQIYADCHLAPKEVSARQNIFRYLSTRVMDRFKPERTPPCESNEGLDLAVQSSLLAIENAVSFGRKQGIPFYFVYLPTPYDEGVNVENLINSTQAKEKILALRRVYGRYRQELAKLGLPEVIDLSDALPAEKAYFLDSGGHYSAEGNKIIAEALLERFWDGRALRD